jgi:hypothetical protein
MQVSPLLWTQINIGSGRAFLHLPWPLEGKEGKEGT